MGIGRRQFLRQFGPAITLVTSSTGAAAGVVEDLYVNSLHGIALSKPRGWEFQSIRDVERVQAGAVFEFPGWDPALYAALLESDPSLLPMVCAGDMRRAKHVPQSNCPEVDEVAPAFHLSFEGTWADDYPDPDAPFSLGAYVEHDLECFAQAYRDFAPPLVFNFDEFIRTARLA